MAVTLASRTLFNGHGEVLPRFVAHESLVGRDAEGQYAAEPHADPAHYADKYMPDDDTRDHAKRMHYSAYRASRSKSLAVQRRHLDRYYRLRDAIVMGNRKLVFRAVRRCMAMTNRSDDLVGECHIVLIQAVAAYNPWMGIRFSTYAYTCLIRALSRLSQKFSTDWLARSLPLDSLPDGEPRGSEGDAPYGSGVLRLDEYLRADHPLLSEREKAIICRRFSLVDVSANKTLERVGAELGLSKERVRQVQASALGKLRRALLGLPPEPGEGDAKA